MNEYSNALTNKRMNESANTVNQSSHNATDATGIDIHPALPIYHVFMLARLFYDDDLHTLLMDST